MVLLPCLCQPCHREPPSPAHAYLLLPSSFLLPSFLPQIELLYFIFFRSTAKQEHRYFPYTFCPQSRHRHLHRDPHHAPPTLHGDPHLGTVTPSMETPTHVHPFHHPVLRLHPCTSNLHRDLASTYLSAHLHGDPASIRTPPAQLMSPH